MINLDKNYTSNGEKIVSFFVAKDNEESKQLVALVQSRTCGVHDRRFDLNGVYKGRSNSPYNLTLEPTTLTQWFNPCLKPDGNIFMQGMFGTNVFKTSKQAYKARNHLPTDWTFLDPIKVVMEKPNV